MTVKQYGSLKINLADIKHICTEGQPTVVLKSGENIQYGVGSKVFNQIWKDYDCFVRNQVVKEASDYCEKDNSDWRVIRGNFNSPYIELKDYVKGIKVFIFLKSWGFNKKNI